MERLLISISAAATTGCTTMLTFRSAASSRSPPGAAFTQAHRLDGARRQQERGLSKQIPRALRIPERADAHALESRRPG